MSGHFMSVLEFLVEKITFILVKITMFGKENTISRHLRCFWNKNLNFASEKLNSGAEKLDSSAWTRIFF